MQTEWGQNWLAGQVTTRLSKDLQSRISIKHVEFGLFNKMNLKDVLVEDRKRDTLLYAGVVQVRITDWFFLQDKVELKYIGLENAIINFYRNDSVWNYQFLQDYFATPSTGKKKKAGIEFNLKKVVLHNVSFNQKDAWIGSDLFVKTEFLDLDANEISLTAKTINANRLDLVKPFFYQYSYDGKKPKTKISYTPIHTSTIDSAALQWNPANWNVTFGSVNIYNGTYKTDKGNAAPAAGYFDAKHLHFTAIDGSIKNLKFAADTFRARVDLATKERSGLMVHSLKTDLRFHPQIMEFDKLFLKTNRSELKDYFAMSFDKIGDLGDFIHAVTMEANFANTNVSFDDIAFFAPGIKDLNKTFYLNGLVKGKVDDLSGKGISIRSGNTKLQGDISVIGLPNINETFINVEAEELQTNYADLASFIPAIRRVTVPNLKKLGTIYFTGTYTGFINDFVTYGTLQTALGTLRTDLNMKLPKNDIPVYSGSIATSNFQLGQFINNSQLGVIAFTGDVKGKGFSWDALDLVIDGNIQKIKFDNYTYQNITAKGRLNKKTFDGKFVIKDPNADLSLNGLITFTGAQPTFDVKADIVKADLKALQLIKEELSLSGKFDLQFTGSSIGDFLGNASISNATLLQKGKRLSFDSLIVSSNYINGVRNFRARSNEFDVVVNGQFDLKSLPDAFTLFLNRYYPSYIKPPRRNIPNQAFTFDITTGVVEDYIQLIDPRLSGFNNSHITGSLNVAANSLTLDADVPQFSFNQYQFSDVKMKGDGNFERLIVTGQVNNAVVSDSLSFPETTFTIQAQNDVSDITINTTANQTINQANLSAQVKTFSNGASILFNPSSFVLNGKTWSIEQGGELDFRKNSAVQGQLVLRESNQEIKISTQPSDVGDWTDLHIALQNLNIGDLSPLFVKTNRIEGLLTGDIRVEDPQNKFNVIADIKTNALTVDNDSIGDVQASLSYNNKTGLFTGKGNNLDPEHIINFDLALDFKDSTNSHKDRISVMATNYPVKILERFIGNLFSDLQGFLTGNIDILGEGANRDYVTKMKLKDAGLKVNFTQVFYKIDDTELEITENEIKLGNMKLRDRDGKTATVRGGITHKSFKNMVFDIVAEVDNNPMELINTSYNDNQQFYGNAKGTGSLILLGPQYDMNMYIEAVASYQDSSSITLPPSRSRVTGAASFMVERKYGKEMSEVELQRSTSNITYEVNLTANPRVNIEVVLDDLTGDVIRGRGTGNLRLRAGTQEPLSMRGRYEIEEGSYLFTFQSFFKKPFVLRSGVNNYIEWTGDPYSAMIRFEAVYKAENVNFAPLASQFDIDDVQNYRGDVNVVAILTGELFKPTFNFKLEFPENSITNNNPSLAFGIQQIENNPNEINKQVTYLIVFNSFAPYQSSITSSLNEFAYSTISGLFFGEVNKRLNQLLSKILRNNDLTFNFTGSLYNRNLIDRNARGFNINQTDLNFSVGLPLLNDRLQITFGGTFDVPLESDIEQSIRLFPDVNVSLLLNKSGSVRATFFYTQTADPLIGGPNLSTLRSQRAGVKLSYRKEFESLSVLFGRKKGKKKNEVLPVDSPGKDSTITSQ